LAESLDKLDHPAFGAASERAGEALRDPGRLARFLSSASAKATRVRGQLSRVLDDLRVLIRMVRAAGTGRYRELPWQGLLMATAAIIYFVNPMDLVPDWLHAVGLLDDATVIGLVVSALAEELQRFREWETLSPDNLTNEESM